MPDIQNDNSTTIENSKTTQEDNNQIPNQPAASKMPEIKFPPFFWSRTQFLINEIEQKINSKILVYFMEPDSSIVNGDVDYFYSHIKDLQKDKSLTLILVSNGGSGMAAWRIANMLKQYCNELTVIIPSRCASAATMLSLSADKILFGPAGYLTAIDTSLNHELNPKSDDKSGKPVSISVDQINRIKEFIDKDLKEHTSTKSLSEILFEKVHPVVIGELERTSNLSKMIAKNMLSLRNNKPDDILVQKIVDVLNDNYPAHAYPIVLKEAQNIGLPAEALSEDISQLCWELTKLYSIISKKVITDINSDFWHMEGIPVMIESFNKRTFYSVSYNKRFKPGFGWNIENDKSKWLAAVLNKENPEKPKISEIEL